jgi:uncharacterized protein YjbJ (UPF0337 family)
MYMNSQQLNKDLLQKVDGHLDELEGKLMQAAGHGAKGGLQVMKGKMKNAQADADIAVQDLSESIKHNIESAKMKVRKDINKALA